MHRPTVQREGQATAAGVGVAEATVTAANCAVPCGFPGPGVPLAAPRVRVAPSALQKEGSREHQGQRRRPPCQCGESRVLNPRRETFGLWLCLTLCNHVVQILSTAQTKAMSIEKVKADVVTKPQLSLQ